MSEVKIKIEDDFEKELIRDIYKTSYYEFFKDAFRILHPNEPYNDNWHIKYICDTLQEELERILRREKRNHDLIINIPFRAAKSMICTIIFPVWCWTVNASIKIISVSYSADLALEHAGRSRDLIYSGWFQNLYGDKVQLKPGNNAKGFYETVDMGFRKAVGTGGQITGSGSDIIIVDDPQNPKLAASEVERKNTIEFYNHTLYSRLNQPDLGFRVVVMQRLNEDDLSGHLIESRPEMHRHICIPAELEANLSPPELKEHYIEELFWHTRFNKIELAGYRKALGSLQFAGQLQQRPAPDEGGIMKRKWFEIVEENSYIRDIQKEAIHFILDSAYTEKQENDPSAVLACFRKDNWIYILHCCEVWLEFPELCEFLKNYVVEHGYNSYSSLRIEPKASGKSIVQQLRATTGLNVVEAETPKEDKITRLHGIAPAAESLRIRIVRRANGDNSWMDPFLTQICMQPNAKRWDMTDCLTMAVNELLFQNTFGFSFM